MILRSIVRNCAGIRASNNIRPNVKRTYSKAADPLRILFCGSDAFSSEALRVLHRLQSTESNVIKSIDVVCRPPKRAGRGLKLLREVPIAKTARDLKLPLHHVDTFNGWQLPVATGPTPLSPDESINLIIAVSFGLLIPRRIIAAAKYGGLNVHPSLLPDFRGAAPIHHTLLAGCTRTGVTLQTLHPTKMDHGKILLQTAAPGLEIPDASNATPTDLTKLLAPIGAAMLAHALEERVFIPPVTDLTPNLSVSEQEALRTAPKIMPTDRHVMWQDWSSDEILRRSRVLGELWSIVEVDGEEVRMSFTDEFQVVAESALPQDMQPGVMVTLPETGRSTAYIGTTDGKVLSITHIKVPGYGNKAAASILKKLRIVSPDGSGILRSKTLQ